jgi:hypothetical protein
MRKLNLVSMGHSNEADATLTNIEAVPNVSNPNGSELRTNKPEKPVSCCSGSRASSSHRKGVDFCLIHPRYHSPRTAKSSVVEKQERDRNRSPLRRCRSQQGHRDSDHKVGEEL